MEDDINNETNESIIENKEAKVSLPVVDKKKKEGSFFPLIFITIISLAMAIFWDKITFVKDAVHSVLDPSAGALLNWNLTVGMLIIILVITFITTLIQKYTTDQKTLKELKEEQKLLQKKSREFKDHPEKMMEIQKQIWPLTIKTFKLTSRGVMFTGIPFILFFRWFYDTFTTLEQTSGQPVLFLGFLSWFWFYLIFTMVFSSFLRKWLKVV